MALLEKTERLLDELTALAVEARLFLSAKIADKSDGSVNRELPAEIRPQLQSEEKPKRTRKPRVAEAAQENGVDPLIQSDKQVRETKVQAARPVAAVKELSEADSTSAANEIAAAFVRRFSNRTDGLTAARRILNEEFKVARLTDLVHAQRLQFIVRLQTEIEKADNGVAA